MASLTKENIVDDRHSGQSQRMLISVVEFLADDTEHVGYVSTFFQFKTNFNVIINYFKKI